MFGIGPNLEESSFLFIGNTKPSGLASGSGNRYSSVSSFFAPPFRRARSEAMKLAMSSTPLFELEFLAIGQAPCCLMVCVS